MISFWLAHLCNNLIVGFEDENMLILSVGCLPISAIWNLTIMPTATCVDRKVLYTIGCSTDILTDGELLSINTKKTLS